MAKLLFFDIENTGVMHWRNGIHQISGCIEIDGEVKEYFDIHVQPNPACTIEDAALAVSNVTREDLAKYETFRMGYIIFTQMLAKYVDKFNKKDKFFLVGYNNASFDNQFLRAFFVQNGDNYFCSYFWSSSIDVMVLSAHYLMRKRHDMVDFKLMTVAKTLGIEVDNSKLHDAEYDINLTRQIYQIVAL